MLCYACGDALPPGNRVFAIQPLGEFSPIQAEKLFDQLKHINTKIQLKKSIPLPASTYYPGRNRYRADGIINYLGRNGSTDTVYVGITSKDISVTKGNIPDWGVMGLGFQPGNACAVSTFRLNKDNLSAQLYKIILHELGHTQGLPHCKNKTCLMRDAEGGNHLEEETGFCETCKSFLKSKGWNLE